jgi:type II secretory pathway pseudopilin PulG
MNKGGYREAVEGFTIVEILIVLAVSAMLVLSAIILISGRANKTQFTTASNNLKQQLEQIINETATGYFPNGNNFTCTAGVAAMPVLSNGSQQQGTNGGCIFLGKAIQFGATDNVGKVLIYAIAGNRLQNGTQSEVTSLAQAYPEAVAPGAGTNTGLNGITVTTPLENGLDVGSMTYAGGNTGGFALLSSLASYTAAGSSCNGVCSGAQVLKLYAIAGTSIGTATSKGFVDKLDGQGAASVGANYVAATQITACFNSGTTNQSVVYKIGGTGGVQNVDMQVQSGSCP